jgi:Ca-activated chloride channel family protein
MRRVLFALLPLLAAWNPLDRPSSAVEQGNAAMKEGKAEAALAEYDRAAAALPAEPGVHFNRGTALFALSRYDEAIAQFMRATEAKTPALKAAAFYNLGNSYFQASRYADAIAAYKRSLALEPGDMRAKWNLELALQKKKEEEKKQQEGKNKQDQQNKDDRQNKDDQNEGRPRPDGGAEQDKQQPRANDAGSPPPPEPQSEEQTSPDKPRDEQAPEMSEIEAVLDSLERSPKELEKLRARLRAVRRAPPAKDW